jgi:hypothetical protein
MAIQAAFSTAPSSGYQDPCRFFVPAVAAFGIFCAAAEPVVWVIKPA